MKTFNDYIKSIKDGVDLSSNESEDAFDQILLQKVDDNKIIDFLTSLSNKGFIALRIARPPPQGDVAPFGPC